MNNVFLVYVFARWRFVAVAASAMAAHRSVVLLTTKRITSGNSCLAIFVIWTLITAIRVAGRMDPQGAAAAVN